MKKCLKIKNYKIKNSQQGVALLWSLLVSAVLLVMAFTLVILTVKELRISSNIDESNRAYLAAEAGMERALYYVKGQIDSNIEWGCDSSVSPVSITNNLTVTTDLRYSATINVSCTGGDTDLREITLESEGVSRETTLRKLKTTTTSAPPDIIDAFDANPYLLTGNDDYYGISGDFQMKPIIIQQFDLFNFNKSAVGGGFTIGMSHDGDKNGDTDFGVEFSQESGGPGDPGGPNIEMALRGNVGGLSIPESSFTLEDKEGKDLLNSSDYYRVKLEYARYGSTGKNPLPPNNWRGYTSLRAIFLKRNSSSGRFECLDNSQGYVVYSGVQRRGSVSDIPNYVKIYKSSPSDWDSDGYIKVGPGSSDKAKLDNMVFWGKGESF